MPITDPFSSVRLSQLAARSQATRWEIILKEVRTFRSYCCDISAADIMGVEKEPVPIVDIDPNPICLGEQIDWDLTASYAPGSTINSWEIDFGDGNSESGSNIALASGSYTYEEIGSYTITVSISEGTGRSQEVEFDIEVTECLEDPGTLGTVTYVGTDGDGVWFIDWLTVPPQWVERNVGLTGTSLFVRSLVSPPSSKHKHFTVQTIWIATQGGVYRSNNGGLNWAKQNLPDPSNDEFLDDPAATIDELDYHHVIFDPSNENIVYILTSKTP